METLTASSLRHLIYQVPPTLRASSTPSRLSTPCTPHHCSFSCRRWRRGITLDLSNAFPISKASASEPLSPRPTLLQPLCVTPLRAPSSHLTGAHAAAFTGISPLGHSPYCSEAGFSMNCSRHSQLISFREVFSLSRTGASLCHTAHGDLRKRPLCNCLSSSALLALSQTQDTVLPPGFPHEPILLLVLTKTAVNIVVSLTGVSGARVLTFI